MSKIKYSLCYPSDIYAQLFKRQTHFSVAAFQIRFLQSSNIVLRPLLKLRKTDYAHETGRTSESQ